MSETQVVFYKEADGSVPTQEWLNQLSQRAQAKCRWLIERLQERGLNSGVRKPIICEMTFMS